MEQLKSNKSMVTFSYIYIFIFSGAKAYYIRFIGANEYIRCGGCFYIRK